MRSDELVPRRCVVVDYPGESVAGNRDQRHETKTLKVFREGELTDDRCADLRSNDSEVRGRPACVLPSEEVLVTSGVIMTPADTRRSGHRRRAKPLTTTHDELPAISARRASSRSVRASPFGQR